MKLRYLFALPILAAALMGCDEIEVSDAKPVENPQLPGITQEDFEVEPAASLTGLMNLDQLSAETTDPDNFMIELYTINVLTDELPESAVVTGGLQLSDNEAFDNPFNIDNISVTEGVVSAPLRSFLDIRSQMFGKDPRPYTVYYRIPVYVTVNGAQYKIGSKDFYFCAGESFTQEGVDPGYVVEEAYYLVGPAGNTCETAIKFEHSQYNIYDDAQFNVMAKFGEGNTSWQIVPQSVYEAANGGVPAAANCYGPTDATALTGVLDLGKTGTLTDNTKYKFTINLSTLEYSIAEVADFDYLYTPGDSNGWNQEASQKLFTDNYVNYQGFAYLNGGFKFTPQPNWDSEFGMGAKEGTLVTSGGGNITVETEGLYWVEVNIDALTYTLTPITTIGMVGSFNGWNEKENEALTHSDNYLTWTGTLTLTDAAEWKFNMNNDWSINLGGAIDDLVPNGGNINSEAGTYNVVLDLSKLPYSCTITAK